MTDYTTITWDTLVDDILVEFMTHSDPLGCVLFGMTNQRMRRLRTGLMARFNKVGGRTHFIWTLLDTYGTVHLLEWSTTVWPNRDPFSRNTKIALEAHNFPVAEWLISQGYAKSGFVVFAQARDYMGMTWCYEHGFKVTTLDWIYAKDTRDHEYINWFVGKNLSDDR